MHLASLLNKIIGEMVFVNISPLHIGVSERDSPLLRLLRLPDGSAIIPSSTWKGVFRTIAERIAVSMRFSGFEGLALKAYSEGDYKIIHGDEELRSYLRDFEDVLLRRSSDLMGIALEELKNILLDIGFEEELEKIKRNKDLDRGLLHRIAIDFLAMYCPVGRLFGNRVLAGKLRFHDTLIGPSNMVDLRPGVGIDRYSGTAKADQLFFTEVTPINSRLVLRFVADNLRPGEGDSRLLANTLSFVEELGIQVGGRKSTGLGLLELEDARFWLVVLREDKGGVALANPIKNGKRLSLQEFKKWLSGT